MRPDKSPGDSDRPDLPGSTTPPLEGARWLWIKIGAWAVAIGVILLVAYLASALIDRALQGAGRGADRLFASVQEALRANPDDDLVRVTTVRTEPVTPPESYAPPPVDDDGVPVTAVSWIRPPRPDFPAEGIRADVEEASVALECTALTTGRASDCRILSEEPSGHGFGAAALAAMSGARLSPRIVDGEPSDATFRFTMRFRID
jgi:TonB family protein